LTYFEFTTLACLWLMQQAQPDFAVLEVGLGGRLDTVNLVAAEVAVIMPIGLDHQQYLGNDVELIGAEKAGVLRTGQAVVCAQPDPPASVLRRAAELACRVLLPGRDYRMERSGDGLRFRMGEIALELPLPPLPGAHQVANLAAALAAACLVAPRLAGQEGAARRGVSATRVSGRLMSLPGLPGVVLDVGHNPLAAEVIAAYFAGSGEPRCLCVLGMLADKDVEAVAHILAPAVETWYCAGLTGERGQSGPALANRLRSALIGASVHVFDTVAEALDQAIEHADARHSVLVFGSFETVAQALRARGAAVRDTIPAAPDSSLPAGA